MKTLAKNIGSSMFSGVIFNGNLTNSMQDDDLIQLEKDYGGHEYNPGIVVYPGLGPHDYENRINDMICGGRDVDNVGFRAWSTNLCAALMLDWFVSRVQSLPTDSFDMRLSGSKKKMFVAVYLIPLTEMDGIRSIKLQSRSSDQFQII